MVQVPLARGNARGAGGGPYVIRPWHFLSDYTSIVNTYSAVLTRTNWGLTGDEAEQRLPLCTAQYLTVTAQSRHRDASSVWNHQLILISIPERDAILVESERRIEAGDELVRQHVRFKRNPDDAIPLEVLLCKTRLVFGQHVPDRVRLIWPQNVARQVLVPALHAPFLRERPIEIRPVVPEDRFSGKKHPPRQVFWLRAKGKLSDALSLHQCVLAYASDMSLLDTSLLPHGATLFTPGLQLASLDHAMWFHRPFRADDWLLYVQESPSAAGARSFNNGALYREDGTLIASVAQEGLVRCRK